jgi:DNA-directed RNA polymerase specialized sigma24 family protein
MARTGDATFEEWLTPRMAQLRRFTHLVTGHPATADDVLQTALAKVLLAWSRAREANDIDAYVRRVIVNTHRG